MFFRYWILIIKFLYRGKETIHSETELIIYSFKWYSPTSSIILSL